MHRHPIRVQYLQRAFALAAALLFRAVVLANSPQPTHACTQPNVPEDVPWPLPDRESN